MTGTGHIIGQALEGIGALCVLGLLILLAAVIFDRWRRRSRVQCGYCTYDGTPLQILEHETATHRMHVQLHEQPPRGGSELTAG